jgi:hypothetical protein
MHGHWSLYLAIAFVCASFRVEGSDTEYRAADLIAGYQYNRSRFPRPRIVYRRAIDFTEAFRKHNPGSTATQSVIVADYWTDGQRCLLRVPKISGPEEEYVVPDDDIRPGSLVSQYAKIAVFSRGAGSSGEFRLWNGLDAESLGSGRVGMGPISAMVTEFAFPPLAAPDTSWDPPATWHPIDRFFAQPESEMKVLGVTGVEGAQTVVLEHTERKPAAEFLQKQVEGKLEVARLTTAWIDPQRGYLPLRMAASSVLLLDGKRISRRSADALLDPDGRREAAIVVRVTRIEACEGGGSIPSRVSALCAFPTPIMTAPSTTSSQRSKGKSLRFPWRT